ncbi:MAG: DJ-1 family glyoxalase III [Oscillospiraceae bacterium]
MGSVYVFLAEGFEEIEALAPVDMLRRAGVSVYTVGIAGKTVKGGQGIAVAADLDGADFELPQDAEMVVLPGGTVGTENLLKSPLIDSVLKEAERRGLFAAAICTAPVVLHKAGLLEDKRVTAYPTRQGELTGSLVTGTAAEVDGRIITGRSAGVALQFSRALITAMCGADKADEVVRSIYPQEHPVLQKSVAPKE